MKRNRRKLRLRGLLLILGVVILVGCLSGLMAYSSYLNDLKPYPFPENEVLFEVESGTTLNAVLEKLESAELIANSNSAKLYAKLNDLGSIRAGEYILTDGMNVHDILVYLSGNNAIVDQVLVTIPEGTWAKDIAKLISEKTNVTEQELLDLWNNEEFLKELIDTYFFLSDDIFHEENHVALEGFLYPETYYFYAETTPEEITHRLLSHTSEILSQYQEEFEKSKYSMYELMTLASLVQFEASNETDMKLVSGIFYKRLESGMKLQASASVCYALYDKYKTQRDCEYNIDYQSKYNTYLVDTFPIGPISNPGKLAIEAILYPTESDYLFFVSDKERQNHYAVTYEEHLKNIKKYLE